ncbi:hypothetical protein H696_05186, partial [Fonticula alba]
MIINTNKTTLAHSNAYVRFLVGTIRKQPLFAWVAMKPVRVWDYLLWLDRANFGGCAFEEHAPAGDGTATTGGGSSAAQPLVLMHWNIQRFLPPRLEALFQSIIHELITLVHARIGEERT